MSAGAVFKLIANDGKADRMIMATKLLNQRIRDVMCARANDQKDDVTPTLVDLERTHILYVNAHFKPFAAIGYEYNKVRSQAGAGNLGSGVQFSIPQFGDFFHDMVCRARLGGFSSSELITPVQGSSKFPLNTSVTAGSPSVTTTTSYNIVDAFGTQLVAGVSTLPSAKKPYRNFVRYCEYPGNRLFKYVKFEVNGNPLDMYDELVPVMLEKFCTPPHKRTGHDRLVGQEVPLNGYGGLSAARVTDEDVVNTPAGVITRGGNNSQSNQSVALYSKLTSTTVGTGTQDTFFHQGNVVPANSGLNKDPANQFDISRKLHQVVNGPQTPKPFQPPLEIWNKLRFWFNDDVRLSIASVSIPFGQRYINIELAKQELLAFEYPSIYLQTIVDTGSIRTTSYNPIMQTGTITPIDVPIIELYINNIFVNPEVHDIYIKRIGFSLIRVYRQHLQKCNSSDMDDKLLSQLKWPIEYMFVGLRPSWNISVTNSNAWRDWHRMTRVVDATSDDPLGVVVPSGASQPVFTSKTSEIIPDKYYLPVPTVDTMTLSSHGIIIFDGFCDTFFNQYLPFHYGGTALVTPDDPGALFINMSLFPRSYQPSGHLNISRARETYLKWTTTYVSTKSTADMIVVAVAINFLLITDGSAVLRYST
jgi:hypothetical protein